MPQFPPWNEPVENVRRLASSAIPSQGLAHWTPTGSGGNSRTDRCADPGDVVRATLDPRGFRGFLMSAS